MIVAQRSGGPETGARLDERQTDTRVLRVHGDLTLAVAPNLCRAVAAALEQGTGTLAVDLRDAKTADVVGLATLLQCGAAVERAGLTFSVIAEESLRGPVLEARLFEELPFVTAVACADDAVQMIEAPRPREEAARVLARSARIGLRQPTWDELALFGRWAADRCLDEMVGSELLYRCRHLGPYHPDDARAAAALVRPRAGPRAGGMSRRRRITCASYRNTFLGGVSVLAWARRRECFDEDGAVGASFENLHPSCCGQP